MTPDVCAEMDADGIEATRALLHGVLDMAGVRPAAAKAHKENPSGYF